MTCPHCQATHGAWGYYKDGQFHPVDKGMYGWHGFRPPFKLPDSAGVEQTVVALEIVAGWCDNCFALASDVDEIAHGVEVAEKQRKRVQSGPTPTQVMQAIQEAIKWKCPDVTLYRNNVGTGWVGSVTRRSGGELVMKYPRPLRAGLEKGSADLIGWTEVVVTPEMVGQRLAVFTSVEVKSGSGRLDADQRDWRDKVTAAGGIARTLRSSDEVGKEVFEL